MSRVLTNNTGLSVAQEASLGVLPGSPLWEVLEPNSYTSFGANITTVARSPISQNRQRRKGTVTDLDSTVEFEADLTLSSFVSFVEGFAFANATNNDLSFNAADTTGTGYTVTALDATQGAKLQFTAAGPISLLFARGYVLSANNGLKPLGADPVTTDTELVVSGLTIETAPSNATLDIEGIRTEAGDIAIVVTGTNVVMTSGNNGSANPVDFTTLGLTVGQFIHIGGVATANRLTDTNFGYARVVTITAGTLTLDKADPALITDTGSSDNEVDLLFGRFIRNVPTNDPDFLERSFQFEVTYPDLDSLGVDEFEYAKGNFCNTLTLNVPLAEKATVSYSFIGTDTEVPSTTQKTNADTPNQPTRTGAFNTTSDCTRLRISEIDESAEYTDFKSLTITLNNGVSPEKVLCNLGAKFMNIGNFEVNVEAQLIFSDSRVASAVRDNRTVSLDFGLKNDDGALIFDIPSMTLGGGGKDFPVNETVLINTTGEAFLDPTTNTSIGISLFPEVP